MQVSTADQNPQKSSHTLSLSLSLSSSLAHSLVQSGCTYLSFTQPPCLLLYWYHNLLLISYFFRFLALFLLYPLSFFFFFFTVFLSFCTQLFFSHVFSLSLPLWRNPIGSVTSGVLFYFTFLYPFLSTSVPFTFHALFLVGAYGEYGANRMAPWVFFFRRGKREKKTS